MKKTKFLKNKKNETSRKIGKNKKRKFKHLHKHDKLNKLNLNKIKKTNEKDSYLPSPQNKVNENKIDELYINEFIETDKMNSNIPSPNSNSDSNSTTLSNNDNLIKENSASSNKLDNVNEVYNLDFYDRINEDNEKVATFFENLLKRKNGDSLESSVLIEELLLDGKSLKTTVDEMYEIFKVYENTNSKCYKDFNGLTHPMDILKLTSNQRRLLIYVSILVFHAHTLNDKNSIWLSYNQTFEVIDKDIYDKLCFCLVYAPYFKYLDEIDVYVSSVSEYEKFFNWESLVKINISIYNNLVVLNEHGTYFTTILTLVHRLNNMTNYYKFNNYIKKDKELYDRYVMLHKKFPQFEDYDF